MNKPTGITRIIKAFGYSVQGLKAAWASEAAFRQEVMAACVLLPLACWLDVSGVERILLIGSVVLVLIVELINSALEATIERISPEHHPLSGKVKDVGSAAVLLALLNAAIVWGVLLLA